MEEVEVVEKPVADPTQHVPLMEKLAFTTGDLATNIIWAALGTFMVFFLTDVAGIPPAIAGVILLVARLLDGVVDIIVGILVDRTHTRWGKARPWMLWMCLPFAALTVALFTVPNISATAKIVYYSVIYLLINVFYSCISIPYSTLNTMITKDQYQRVVLNIFRMVAGIVAAMGVNGATKSVVNSMGGDAAAWQKVFIIYAAIALVCYLIVFFFTKERVKTGTIDKNESAEAAEAKAIAQKANGTLGQQLIAIAKNKYLWMVLFISLALFLSNGMSAVNIYYTQYLLHDTNLMMPLSLATGLPMMVIIFFVSPFIKKFGKRKVALFGAIVSLVGCLVMVINPANFLFIMIGTVIKGAGMAPIAATSGAMLYDTIEYGQWKHGLRTEGLICSTSGFTAKVGAGLSTALVGWLLAAGGYIANAATQTAGTYIALQTLFVYIPLFLTIAIVILLWFFKLDKIYPTIEKELKERELAAANK